MLDIWKAAQIKTNIPDAAISGRRAVLSDLFISLLSLDFSFVELPSPLTLYLAQYCENELVRNEDKESLCRRERVPDGQMKLYELRSACAE